MTQADNAHDAHGPSHLPHSIDDMFPVNGRALAAIPALDANGNLIWFSPGAAQSLLSLDDTPNLHWLAPGVAQALLSMNASDKLTWLAPGAAQAILSLNASDQLAWFAAGAAQSILSLGATGALSWLAPGAAQALLSLNASDQLAWLAAGASSSILTLDSSGHLAWMAPSGVPAFLWTDAAGHLGWFPKDEIIGVVAAGGYQLPTSDVTMRNVTGAVTTLPANSTWHFVGSVKYLSSAAAKFKFQFTVPAGAQLRFSSMQYTDATGTPTFVMGAPAVTPVTCQGDGTNLEIEIAGTVTIAGTPGDLQLQAAQNVATAELTDFVVGGTSIIGKRVL